jgi:16S rRNA (uracil1498-N3)-methyltransferase
MRVTRLFVEASLRPGSELALPAAPATHAIRVLRLKPGDAVTLFNGDGREYPARLLAAGARDARVANGSAATPTRESPLQITLVQAIARGEKMDWIIQKATELGAVRIVPVATARSEVKLDASRGERRLGHWRAIVVSACEQCGRTTLPRIEAPVSLAAWLDQNPASSSAMRWMLHPEGTVRMRDLQLSPPATLELAIGPEGGFGDADLDVLRAHDFRGLTLGPRVLRAETAGVAAIAALQSMYGDW